MRHTLIQPLRVEYFIRCFDSQRLGTSEAAQPRARVLSTLAPRIAHCGRANFPTWKAATYGQRCRAELLDVLFLQGWMLGGNLLFLKHRIYRKVRVGHSVFIAGLLESHGKTCAVEM